MPVREFATRCGVGLHSTQLVAGLVTLVLGAGGEGSAQTAARFGCRTLGGSLTISCFTASMRVVRSRTCSPRASSGTTAGRGAALPAADLTVTLTDYAFSFSHPPTRGHHRIAVTNRGRQPHELILSRLVPGRTSADFVHWMDTQDGPPPVQPYGGATDLPPGGTIVLDVDLEPGRYSVVCRVRDASDGQPHDRHGMYTDFTVP